MDTSPEYVNMCEQAEEIQALKGNRKKPRVFEGEKGWESGDVYSYRGLTDVFEQWSYSEGIIEDIINSGECIWLPRQDQLQDLLRGDGTLSNPRRTVVVLFHSLLFFVERLALENRLRLTSGEQLWLAFVMSERYEKTWNGQEWVKIPVEVKSA